MMKMFFVFFAIVLLPINTRALCPYGCSCYDDSPCKYYCENYMCQQATPLWKKCSSYYIHPRQCGDVSYCDPNSNYTCQLQKNYGERCTYSFSCLSGNCDYRTNTCQLKYSPADWLYPAVLPSVIVFILFVLLVALIVARRRRLRALGYYRRPYVVLPSGGSPCSYQNSYMIGETPPPPYPGVRPTSFPKTYENS